MIYCSLAVVIKHILKCTISICQNLGQYQRSIQEEQWDSSMKTMLSIQEETEESELWTINSFYHHFIYHSPPCPSICAPIYVFCVIFVFITLYIVLIPIFHAEKGTTGRMRAQVQE